MSNVQVMRDIDGKLSLWCGGERLIGVGNISIVPDNSGMHVVVCHIPMQHVTLGESGPREVPQIVRTEQEENKSMLAKILPFTNRGWSNLPTDK